jgi:hypothetical protein
VEFIEMDEILKKDLKQFENDFEKDNFKNSKCVK